MPTVGAWHRRAQPLGRERDARPAAPAGSSRRRPPAPAAARCRAAGCAARCRPGGGVVTSRSMPQRNAASVLPEPVGARISVCSPAAMAGQPCAWAAVGAGNEVANHARTGSEKRSSAAMAAAYGGALTVGLGASSWRRSGGKIAGGDQRILDGWSGRAGCRRSSCPGSRGRHSRSMFSTAQDCCSSVRPWVRAAANSSARSTPQRVERGDELRVPGPRPAPARRGLKPGSAAPRPWRRPRCGFSTVIAATHFGATHSACSSVTTRSCRRRHRTRGWSRRPRCTPRR